MHKNFFGKNFAASHTCHRESSDALFRSSNMCANIDAVGIPLIGSLPVEFAVIVELSGNIVRLWLWCDLDL